MPSYRELTREIDRSPSGPKTAAFFDVDRTLLAGLNLGNSVSKFFSALRDLSCPRMSAVSSGLIGMSFVSLNLDISDVR